ncbi:MAG TPA: hypothetical protein VI233_09070 [Puia sp.]
MYNPFPLLTTGLLEDELTKGKRYFVRQTFARGWDAKHKAAFLLRSYPEEEKEMAELHLKTLEKDGNAFLYDATLPEHREKLRIAAKQPIGYKVFYAARKGVEWKPPQPYQEKMRHYIRRHHSDWRSTNEGGKIEIGLFEEFGELFLKFSHGGEEDTIPFDHIEKY